MKKKPNLPLNARHDKVIKITIPPSPPHKFLGHLLKKNFGTRVSTPVGPQVVSLTCRRPGEKLVLGPFAHSRIRTPQCQVHVLPTRTSVGKAVPSKIIRANLIKACKRTEEAAHAEYINKLIYNDKAHIVSCFKEYLVFDDIKELLQRYFTLRECSAIFTAFANRPIPFRFHWPEYKLLGKAEERKKKIKRLKEETNTKFGEEASTFLRTAYMNSLAKEDLSNSVSRLPANSLECSNVEDCGKILSLLSALNEKEEATVRKSRIEPKPPAQKAKVPLNKSPRITNTKTTAKLLTQLKGLTLGVNNPPPLNSLKKTETLSIYYKKSQNTSKDISMFSRTLTKMNTTSGVAKLEPKRPPALVPPLKSVLAAKRLCSQAQSETMTAKNTVAKTRKLVNTPRTNKAFTSIGTYAGNGSIDQLSAPRILVKNATKPSMNDSKGGKTMKIVVNIKTGAKKVNQTKGSTNMKPANNTKYRLPVKRVDLTNKLII